MTDRPDNAHPDFTHERLHLVGRALADARDSAQQAADFERGDDSWCIGCTAYARSRASLVELATRHPDWLTIVNAGMEFQFTIGPIPVRFYHGDSDAPSARHSQKTAPEARQLELGFGDAVYRMAVMTNEHGLTESVNLVRLVGRDVTQDWNVWARAAIATPNLPEGKNLSAPEVEYAGEETHVADKRATGTRDGT